MHQRMARKSEENTGGREGATCGSKTSLTTQGIKKNQPALREKRFSPVNKKNQEGEGSGYSTGIPCAGTGSESGAGKHRPCYPNSLLFRRKWGEAGGEEGPKITHGRERQWKPQQTLRLSVSGLRVRGGRRGGQKEISGGRLP